MSELLNPKPGSVVLDMCAAPGMKTIHLSNLMQNSGKIYAVEQNEHRFQLLRNMVLEAQASCVEPIKGDVLAIGESRFIYIFQIIFLRDSVFLLPLSSLKHINKFQLFIMLYSICRSPARCRIYPCRSLMFWFRNAKSFIVE